ncbi:MAG TPA: CbtA family protein [Ktedonobacteraceae bacterium]|nr:CbtA family protein [Ktedonobacteraceae bacterium]
MHQRSSPATIIGLTLLAGLVAGLLVACFHFFATEPTLQRAIDLETAHKMALGQLDPEVFTRPEQRAGLFLGYILYGIGWGSLFGIICWFAQARLSEASKVSWEWVFGLLFICYWTFCLFPQLKYPANPPGVGDATTIDIRQRLYLEGIFLSILGSALAPLLYYFLGRLEEQGKISRRIRLLIVLVGYGLYAVIVWFTLPPYPISVPISMDLVMAFRWLSGIGTALFWLLMGSIFLFCWQYYLTRRENKHQGQTHRSPSLAK